MRFLVFFLVPVLSISQNSKIDSLVTLLELKNKDEKLLILMGESYASQKKWDSAIFYYKKLVDIKPNNANYLYRLGGSQAAHSESASTFKALSLINSAKVNLIKSSNIDKSDIYSRWVLVQILLELPNFFGGDDELAFKFSEEIYKISKFHGLISKSYMHNFLNEFDKAEQTERIIIDLLNTNKRFFDYNHFNFLIAKFLSKDSNADYSLSNSYLNIYIDNHSHIDRVSKAEAYYYLAFNNFKLNEDNSSRYLMKSIELLKSQKQNKNLSNKIEKLKILLEQ
tara:strand:+ start:68 stop:913 length:846 start_codon:yes stop_codon:yes gene_type:complete